MKNSEAPAVVDPDQKAKYTVLEKSLIGNQIFEAGATAEYAGLPSENLEPQCDIGRARYQEYLRTNAARVTQMRAEHAEQSSGIGDPSVFAKAIADAIAVAVKQAFASNSKA